MSTNRYARIGLPIVWISAINSVLLVLIALSFSKYFFFAPSATNPTLAVFQVIYLTGWILLAALPPVVLLFVANPGRLVKSLLIAAVSIFPFAAIADHITLAASYGDPYLGYLVNYPILFVSHAVIPVIYILIFSLMNEPSTIPARKA